MFTLYRNCVLSLIFFSSIYFTACDEQEEKDPKYWNLPVPPSYPGYPRPPPGLSNDECVNNIYRRCNYPTTFTDQGLENVRLFFNYTFTQLADIKPDKPLCPKLHVRQDWKCLTDVQRQRIVDVWRQMYAQGILHNLTDFHVKNWPAWHKSPEFFVSHRWLVLEFENYMRYLDPNVSLPYWNPWLYGCQPERASVWDTLGHYGTYSNGYCVEDGIYGNITIVPCLKRHWKCDGTIYPYVTTDIKSSLIQTSSFADILAQSDHFEPHIAIGGAEGQYSIRSANYDLIFYMHHTFDVDNILTLYQLRANENLTPLDYNGQFKFNQINGQVEPADIATDTLTGVPGATIREYFWLGFGDMCYVADQFIKPINKLWKSIVNSNYIPEPDPIPIAIKRMPQWLIKKYFPLFYSGKYSNLSHILEDVGECNTQRLQLPKPTFLRETQTGRNQLQAFIYDNGIDLEDISEQYIYQMWLDFNRAGYFSPYVTTY